MFFHFIFNTPSLLLPHAFLQHRQYTSNCSNVALQAPPTYRNFILYDLLQPLHYLRLNARVFSFIQSICKWLQNVQTDNEQGSLSRGTKKPSILAQHCQIICRHTLWCLGKGDSCFFFLLLDHQTQSLNEKNMVALIQNELIFSFKSVFWSLDPDLLADCQVGYFRGTLLSFIISQLTERDIKEHLFLASGFKAASQPCTGNKANVFILTFKLLYISCHQQRKDDGTLVCSRLCGGKKTKNKTADFLFLTTAFRFFVALIVHL